MKAHVVNQSKKQKPTVNVQKWLDAIVCELMLKKVRNKKLLQLQDVTVVYLDAPEMRRVNSQFRGKNKPTDVLSFAPVEDNSLGEILFCIEVLKKQAREHGHSYENEFLYMLIHGVLHLLGYDHEKSRREEQLMFDIQDKLFQRLLEH